jgi:hypothetical protein
MEAALLNRQDCRAGFCLPRAIVENFFRRPKFALRQGGSQRSENFPAGHARESNNFQSIVETMW